MTIRYKKKNLHLYLFLCLIFISTLAIATEGQPVRKSAEISGNWDSNMSPSYHITQEDERGWCCLNDKVYSADEAKNLLWIRSPDG